MNKRRIKRNSFYFIQFCILAFGVSFPFWQTTEIFNIYHWAWIVIPAVIFSILFALAFGTAFSLNDATVKTLKKIVSYWIAGGFIVFCVFLVTLLLNVFLGLPQPFVVFMSLGISSLLIIYAYHHGSKLSVNVISFSSSKITKPYTFVQLSDIHVGSNGIHEVERIIDTLEKIEYDFVVITGDLIDEDYATMHDLKPLSRIEKPIFYITGNHEYYLRKKSFRDFLKGTDIQDVNDRKISFKELDILGIDERSDATQTLDLLGVDTGRYNLCLMHEPKTQQLQIAANRTIDLMLSGHTHNGQIFPFSLMVKARFPYLRGVYSLNDMNIHVSQGTGTWGPKMRLGTSNEITVITLNPES